MLTIFPFFSRLFMNKAVLFRMYSPLLLKSFISEYIGDTEKVCLFCRHFNQTGIIKQ